MKPVQIADPDVTLTSPDPQVGDLLAARAPDGSLTSVWALDDDELALLRDRGVDPKVAGALRNLRVLLTVEGDHPPVALRAQVGVHYENLLP